MPDDPTPPVDPPQDTPPPTPPADPPELGDAGRRALDAERTARAAAERDLKAAQAALEKVRRDSMSESERAIATAREEAKAEVLASVTARLVGAEVRAVAAGKLADPSDAMRYLDASTLVDVQGEPDANAIASAIDALVKDRPYLAPAPERTNGAGDGGARTTTAAPDATPRGLITAALVANETARRK
jgi:type IV secretory pathway VirB10-like protein